MFLLEGEYSHYKGDEIEDIYSQIAPVINFLKRKLRDNKVISFDEIGFSDTPSEGLKGIEGFYFDEEGSVYKNLDFNPEDSFLIDSNKEKPLSLTFVLTKGLPQGSARKAYYERHKASITLRVDLDAEALRKYNFLLSEIPKHRTKPVEYAELMIELTEMKKRLFYYMDPYLIKLVTVHEMVHWLDDLHDSGIYDLHIDEDRSWIDMVSEQNAILHQIQYLKSILDEDSWNKLTLVEIFVLVRIRRDFIHGILQDIIKNPKKNWATDFSKKMKKYNVYSKNTLSFNPDKYYEMGLLADKVVYRNFYLYLRDNIF